MLNGRRRATLEAVCKEIRAEGGSADCRVGDVTDLDHLEELMALAAGGPTASLDILVNNAGIAGPTRRLSRSVSRSGTRRSRST